MGAKAGNQAGKIGGFRDQAAQYRANPRYRSVNRLRATSEIVYERAQEPALWAQQALRQVVHVCPRGANRPESWNGQDQNVAISTQ